MKIIIVGYGRNGPGLAQAMSKVGYFVTVIDSDPTVFEQLDKHFQRKTVKSIGFDKDVLQKTQIEHIDTLAALTSSDESGAVIARVAKGIYHIPEVVACLYDREEAEIYERLGVRTLSLTTWGTKRASDLPSYSTLNQAYSSGSGETELVRAGLPTLLAGHRVNELTVAGDIHVVTIECNNRTLLSTTGAVFQKDDVVYTAATSAPGGQLHRPLDKTM